MTARMMVTAPMTISTMDTHEPGREGEQVQGDPGQEVDAQELVDARRQDGHERQRGVQGGIRDPAVERHGPRLAEGPDHQEDEGDAAHAVHRQPDGRQREACRPGGP